MSPNTCKSQNYFAATCLYGIQLTLFVDSIKIRTPENRPFNHQLDPPIRTHEPSNELYF